MATMRSFSTLLLLAATASSAQELYFPPNTAGTWETVDPAALGWCTDQIPPLLAMLEENDTKAFLLLKDGRIAIEHYFGTFTQDSVWYWASAGKSLTAFLAGMAQEDGLLDIDAPSSTYLGTGWTSCTTAQEAAITVRHQLTMTTGLDDGVPNSDCTDPSCLQYLAAPGTRWAYHNAPYTLLDGVLEGATGQDLNAYLFSNLTLSTGITGLYVQVGDNNVFFSTPRSMARFGLLALNNGTWNTTPILADLDYFTAMTTPSQALNPSYGYLWWLNGQESYMVPGLQIQIPGMLMPNEPADAFNALGKNGQFINVVPSEGLVLIRMGDVPGSSLVPFLFNDEIWEYLNAVLCSPTGMADVAPSAPLLTPTVASSVVQVDPDLVVLRAEAIGADGRRHRLVLNDHMIDVSALPAGAYAVVLQAADGLLTQRIAVVR